MNPSTCCHSIRRCAIGLLSCLVFSVSAFAQEEPATQPKPAEPEERVSGTAPNTNRPTGDKSKNSKEKIEKATIALSAVIGIAILGIAAIAAVMMGAKYLRRIARDAGPTQRTVGNDFWFLKPQKPHQSEDEHMETHRPTHTPPETETGE